MKTFRNIKENTSITPEKKEQMWVNIVKRVNISEAFVGENVRIESTNRHTWWGVKSKTLYLFTNHKNMVIAAKIIASILVGSMAGTSILAEQALPGEALYSFKVDVNESIRGAFTFGSEADASWEVEKVERRATEKAELEAKAHMTPRAQAIIVTESNASSEKAHEALVKLRSEWKSELAGSLEVSLNNSLKLINTTEDRDQENDEDKTEWNIGADTEVEGNEDTEIEVGENDETKVGSSNVELNDVESDDDVNTTVKSNTVLDVKSTVR